MLVHVDICHKQYFQVHFCRCPRGQIIKVKKGSKIRNQYNQVPHLTQDTNWKVTNSQLDTTNESQEVSPFPTGDHKAHINRRAQRHSKQKSEKNKISKQCPLLSCRDKVTRKTILGSFKNVLNKL